MADLQKIRTVSTGALTPRERESLQELVKEYNSDFRVKTATVPFVGDILPEEGAIVVSGHDGRMYRADQRGWNLMGVDSPIMLFVDYTDTQFDFKFKLPAGKFILIDDGDGTRTIIEGQDGTVVTHTTTYSTPGTYTFYVEGDYVDLTVLNFPGYTFVSGDISRYGELVNLTYLIIAGCAMYGSIESLRFCTSLTLCTLQKNHGIYGEASTLSTFGNITLSLWGTAITFNSVVPMTKTGGSAEYGLSSTLTPAMIDNIFNSYQASSATFRIEVYGTDNPRTAASNDAIVSLIQNGCKVGFDSVDLGLGTLGAEMHTDANAASIANEANAVTGWTPTGLSGSNEFISQAVEKTTGSYALKAQCNGTPTSSARFIKAFTVTANSYYKIVFDWKHIGTGNTWGMWLCGGAFIQIQTTETDWTKFECYYKAPSTSFEVRFTEYHGDNDGGIYMDNFSFKEITF